MSLDNLLLLLVWLALLASLALDYFSGKAMRKRLLVQDKRIDFLESLVLSLGEAQIGLLGAAVQDAEAKLADIEQQQ